MSEKKAPSPRIAVVALGGNAITREEAARPLT